MRNEKVLFVTRAAMIAAVYVVLTYLSAEFSLASGSVQLRLSEALCVLPYFTPAAIPGLFVGCLAANLLTGAVIWDVIFGSLATLIGAVGTYYLRKHRFLCTLPPVISNTVIIPAVLILAYHIPAIRFLGANITYWFTAFTVGLGEIIMICVVGYTFLRVLERYRSYIFDRSGAVQ